MGGTSVDCADPGHEYTSAGVYTVSLTVSELGGSDTLTRTRYIAVFGKEQKEIYLPLVMKNTP